MLKKVNWQTYMYMYINGITIPNILLIPTNDAISFWPVLYHDPITAYVLL